MPPDSDDSTLRKPLRLVRARTVEATDGADTGESGSPSAPPTPLPVPEIPPPAKNAFPTPPVTSTAEPAPRLILRRNGEDSLASTPPGTSTPTPITKPTLVPKTGETQQDLNEDLPEAMERQPLLQDEDLLDDEEEELTPPPLKRAGTPPSVADSPLVENPASPPPVPHPKSSPAQLSDGTQEDSPSAELSGTGEQDTPKPPPPPSSNEIAAARFRQIRNGILLSVILLAVFIGGIYGIFWVLSHDSGSDEVPSASTVRERVIETSPSSSLTATPLQQTRDVVTQVNAQAASVEQVIDDASSATITARSEETTIAIIGRPIHLTDPHSPDEASTHEVGQPGVTGEPSPAGSNAQRTQGTQQSPRSENLINPRITEQMVSDFIATLNIGGIRASADNPRATINGEHLAAGAIINELMGLRFIGAQESTLFFEDVNGRIYRRRF